MLKMNKLLSLLFVVGSLLLFFGCGQSDIKPEEKAVTMTVPLVQDCSQGIPAGAQTYTGPNGQCLVFNAYSSQVIQLPYAQSDIETIKLNLIDPYGTKHQVGQLNGDINSIQVGNYIWITDVRNPNQALARLNIRGNQAMAEINFNDGSNTVGEIYQSRFQNQMSAQVELVFTKKK